TLPPSNRRLNGQMLQFATMERAAHACAGLSESRCRRVADRNHGRISWRRQGNGTRPAWPHRGQTSKSGRRCEPRRGSTPGGQVLRADQGRRLRGDTIDREKMERLSSVHWHPPPSRTTPMRFRSLALAMLLPVLVVVAAKGQTVPVETTGHEHLVEFFFDWREFAAPNVVNGVPDYSRSAMATQHGKLRSWK